MNSKQKKYLIDERHLDIHTAEHLDYFPDSCQEIEVVEKYELEEKLYEDTELQPTEIEVLTNYLKANNLLIIKIKE